MNPNLTVLHRCGIFIPTATATALLFMIGAQSALPQELLLRYTFDESDSGSANAADLGAAPAAPGVFVGAARIGNAPGGFSKGALDLTGATADSLKYVTGGDAEKLDGLEAFTLTAWINVQDVPVGNRRILAKQSGGAFDGFSWNVNDPADGERSAANFGLRLFVGGEKGFAHDLSGDRVSIDADNKWTFVAITYDGRLDIDNVMYYSGSVDNSVTHHATTTIDAGRTMPTDARFTVSHTDAAMTANTALQGWMDDVRVYSGVMNAEQLNAVRLENLGPAPGGVQIINPRRSGQTFSFEFESQAGATYMLQFKNSLDDLAWQSLHTITGNGQTVTATDTTATTNTRFYQIATQ